MSTAVVVNAPGTRLSGIWNRLGEFALPIGAISVMFVMLVPLPSAVLDMLLALSIAASVIVFLSAVQVRRAVELSVFPTLLLLLTLFRLSLNIASSRRILLHGSEGTSAAGKVIEAFGQFVVGGNYVVGFVLFLALIAIQFLVVSHGAVRTAEVTARFTLDALPGKQMAIDADLNAGLINEQEARRRRQTIAREAEFYGAMDGAARCGCLRFGSIGRLSETARGQNQCQRNHQEGELGQSRDEAQRRADTGSHVQRRRTVEEL